MGFRVAHAAVEFQRFGLALRVNHQAGIQKTGERDAVLLHAFDGGQNDFAHRPAMHFRGHHWCRGISTHAAGVGTLVAIEQALVVLAGRHDGHIFTVTHHDEAGFLALQKLFNHHPGAAGVVGHAQRVEAGVRCQHEIDRFVRLVKAHSHHHTLACRQSVGLDDDRRTLFVDVGMRSSRIGESFVLGCGDAVALHEGFGKRLGAFKLRGRLGWPEHPHSLRAKGVNHAGGQRLLGAHHGERYLFCSSPGKQFIDICDIDVLKTGIHGGSAIAGGHVYGLHLGRLRQLPCQRMLTATAANH